MRGTRIPTLLIVGALLLPGLEAPGQTAEPSTYIINVNVVPMDEQCVLPDHVVVVRNGRIDTIAPRGKIDIAEDGVIIDGRGGYLLPGLADMHVHANVKLDQIAYIANGITSVRNMWGGSHHLRWRQEVAENPHALLCTIYTAAALADGDPPSWPGSRVLSTPEEARDYVRQAQADGYDFLKVYSRLQPAVYEAIVDEAKKVGIPFAGHVPDAVGLEKVLASGQASIEHLDEYFEALQRDGVPKRELRTAQVNFIDEEMIPELARRTREAGVWNCVTLVVTDKGRVMLQGGEQDRPEMKYVAPGVREWWIGSSGGQTPAREEQLRDFEKAERMRRTITRALHEAGARILLGTDTANPFVFPGFSIHEELANLVECGLTPYEAIRAGTHDAAEFLGELSEFGTIRPGRRADLMLVEHNPLDDVANLKTPRGVMLRGQWLDRAALDRHLEMLAEAHAN